MKLIKSVSKAAIILTAILFIFSFDIKVNGIENNNITKIKIGKLKQTSDGIKFQCNNSNDAIDIKLNSKGLNKGYYTFSIISDKNEVWSNYGGICFNIKNDSDKNLRFNFFIDLIDGTRIVVGNDKFAIIKANGSERMERVHPSFGTIEISSGFEGKIYVPFNCLEKQGVDKQKTIYDDSKILDWGIIATSPENEEESFSVSDFGLIDKNAKIIKDSNVEVDFQGDTQVQLPVVGESIAQYKALVRGTDSNISYGIANPVKGVIISKDGLLSISTNVKPQKIKINAILENTIVDSKEVLLFKSWTLSAKEVDGTSKSIPKVNEVKNILGNTYKFLLSNRVINIIRIGFFIVVIAFCGIYIYWKNKREM